MKYNLRFILIFVLMITFTFCLESKAPAEKAKVTSIQQKVQQNKKSELVKAPVEVKPAKTETPVKVASSASQDKAKECNEKQVLTVDLAVVLEKSKEAQEGQAKMKHLVEDAQKEFEALFAELNKKGEELREIREKLNNPALSEEARKEIEKDIAGREEELQKKQQHMEQYQQTLDRSLGERHRSILEDLMKKIQETARSIAFEKKSCLVLNTTGPNVIWAEASLEITTEVIARLNKAYESVKTKEETLQKEAKK